MTGGGKHTRAHTHIHAHIEIQNAKILLRLHCYRVYLDKQRGKVLSHAVHVLLKVLVKELEDEI